MCTHTHTHTHTHTENVATLFRASTLTTMLMDQFMKLTASEYLHSMLKGPIQQILESPESCEVVKEGKGGVRVMEGEVVKG